MEELFEKSEKLAATRQFVMTASFLEIYNEKLKDLTDANPGPSRKGKSRRLTVMTGQTSDLVKINGVTTVRLNGVEQVAVSS